MRKIAKNTKHNGRKSKLFVSLQRINTFVYMKIALIGYGKMGKMIEQIAISRGHEIVSIIDIDNQQDFESEAFASADVAIEFTAPQAAYGNYLKAFSKNVKVVSGSTGWMKEHGDDVKRLCTEGGQTLFWASNFSIGVAIFSAVNRYLAKIMNQFPQYDVELEETHHVHKLDQPSRWPGTSSATLRGRRTGRKRPPIRPSCVSTISAAERLLASIPCVTTRKPTSSVSPTTPTRARDLRSVPCWLLSIPPTTVVC